MKKKIVGILVCTLFLATTVLPVVGTMNVAKTKNVEKNIVGENNVGQNGTTEDGGILPRWELPGLFWSRDMTNGELYLAHIDDKVGIGTSSPRSKLEVAGDITITNPTYTDDWFEIGSREERVYMMYMHDGGCIGSVSIDWAGQLDAESLHSWFGYTTEWGDIWVKQGNVGIGTTSPATDYKLHVNGDDNHYGIYAYSEVNTGATIWGSSHGGSYSHGVYGSSLNGNGVLGYGGTYDFYAVGPGTNYGPFTGAHEVKLSKDFPKNIKLGMVVSVTGETQIRKIDEKNISFSSTLPTVELSNTPNDKKVLGALIGEAPLGIDHWYTNEADEDDRFGIVNALGDGRVWVANINGDIEAGDYITTSVIAGYGQKQGDDVLHSYTLGKAIEDVDWSEVIETVEYNGLAYKAYPISVIYTSG